jgi:tRNA N6-adenosine threonylcarbamoyltransferase
VSGPLILGLETSCDETSAAVTEGPSVIRGHVIHSQDVHEVYGGVVPELAARAHVTRVDSVVGEALARAGCTLGDLDAIAVTAGPGLIGALLVGVTWAKAAAFALNTPLITVHHMEGHLFAPSLENPGAEPPFVGLLVSGGHTLLLNVPAWGEYHLLGETRDDAAGEAFDKVAKLLGLAYPGGPEIERVAASGDPDRFKLPRPMLRGNQSPGDSDYYDFSFSGLKTAISVLAEELGSRGRLIDELHHVASSFQMAAVDTLASKTMRAVEQTGCRRVLLGGGVSANSALRSELSARIGSEGAIFYASPRLSQDNGAMIARAGLFRMEQNEVAGLDATANPSLPFPGLIRA